MNTFERIRSKPNFKPPENWLRIKTIDMHTCGEPLRVIVDGFPHVAGRDVLDCRRIMLEHFDHLRTALMFEPRGHADMYGCLLVPPNHIGKDDRSNDPVEAADFGIIFMHNEGYSTMCGHAIIAISKLAIEMGWIIAQEGRATIKIDAPCGRIESFVALNQDEVESIWFHCVPSFAVGLDRVVNVPGIGSVTYDLAYGGAFYAYVDVERHSFDFDLTDASYRQLIDAGMRIKQAVIQADHEIIHPFEKDLSFLYGTIFVGKSLHGNDSRNVCIFADGEVDRCPTGSGVSGRMAIHHARGELEIGQPHRVESIIDSVFTGSIVKTTSFGTHSAVIPQVEGTANITGEHTFFIDPDDPMAHGFLLR